MCGIAGFCGSFDPVLLDRMNNRIAHRGPDDSGTYHDAENGIGLAHRRLSIIDLSPAGHQPMWDAQRRAVIAFNGEIYNYRELKDGLRKDGFAFAGNSDTEVLLNLYLRDGDAMLSKLNGIFAFAIFEPKEKKLFIARDGLGVKPLYYALTPKGLIFSSELKALLAEPTLDRTLDLCAAHHYLTYLWSPGAATMLRSVRKLEPGCAMTVQGGSDVRRYYDLPYQEAPAQTCDPEEAASAVREAVQTAVTRQLVADVPVGAFLSGGLDSSAVVAAARRATPNAEMNCFTIGFSDGSMESEGFAEDLPYAQEVARHLNVNLHTVTVGPEMADRVPEMIRLMDEPQADPAPLNALLICELSRKHGIKVLLSGAGGDDIFTGYRRHFAVQQEKYWQWLPAGCREMLTVGAGLFPATSSLGRRLSKAFSYAGRTENERTAGYFHWIKPSLQQLVYGEGLRHVLHTEPFSAPLVAALESLPNDLPRLQKMMYLEKFFLIDHNLNYTDKMSMASGVEVRVPLLDPDLVKLAAALPVNVKQNGRCGKWIFKKAMEPWLPHDVIYRPKTGFGAPLRKWLRGPLSELVEDVLSPKSVNSRGLFDASGIQRLIALDRAGKVEAAYPIFALMCMELWCRSFLDKEGE